MTVRPTAAELALNDSAPATLTTVRLSWARTMTLWPEPPIAPSWLTSAPLPMRAWVSKDQTSMMKEPLTAAPLLLAPAPTATLVTDGIAASSLSLRPVVGLMGTRVESAVTEMTPEASTLVTSPAAVPESMRAVVVTSR